MDENNQDTLKEIEELNEKIRLNPNNANFYNSRGNCNYFLKKYEEAVIDYNKAIELDPNNAVYYNLRGNCNHFLKKYKEAIIDYNKAIELDPNNATYYNNRGKTKYSLEDYENAIIDYNKAIEVNPNEEIYYIYCGICNYNLKNYKEALKNFENAIQLNPNNATYYNNRGKIKYFLEDYKKAIKDYDKALELNPYAAITYKNRAESKYMLENYKDALIDINKAIELNNADETFIEIKKKIEKAITENSKPEIKKVNEIINEENNPTNLYNDGLSYYLKKEFDDAINNFSNFIFKANDLNNKTNEIIKLLKITEEYIKLAQEKILKTEAYLTFADILGWKGIWQRENHIDGKKNNILKLIQIKNKLIDIKDQYIEKKDISIDINLISDTFVIGCTNLEIHNKLCAELITTCLNKKLLIRGATAYGEYYYRDMVYIGQAVDEAASWHEKGEEIGIFYTPSARLKLENKIKEKLENKVKKDLKDKNKKEFLEEIGLFEKPIITKIGEINSYVIPWFKEEENKNCFFQIMEKEIVYPEISKKYFNTEKTIKNYENPPKKENDSK
ncbi:tetratricopeptide repeat protein [Fusobacterium ulcerans]|uniref:TPR repeat-containing protein yrrB n=1 Tax=Fusobacterium ulcerans TaxID=861 RepID=A0AAX2J8X0_9FUSO|nr:tetratricopeptide repeat protein [Fusobacterium ulcerans]AVQ28833.1 tetratricopeptide repeat protein [Fusobacterium ulcerans]EFS26315.1 hypothetical protein FUAG_01830 [Fusobacterium ulcerans ATCC 49185]SQJ00976.1 TPR repeat-containing protein yrrB [Fusobacterium ulcerans]